MKKKAFTLTELLVVVVIIGVLAAVVLPKFTQVLETRRTTEAEEIMRAVRSEQEARCTLDKNYTANRAELASFPANEGNNYYYSFTATGIAAVSRNKDYTLRIQSYRDGEICCDGDDCAHLGKTYPVCPARVVAVDECAAETACNLRSYSEACPSGQEGQVLFVPNADCTGYEQVNQCHDITVDPTTCSEGATRNVNRNCAGSSGERCEGGVWKSFTSTDDGTPQPGNTTQTCPTGDTVTCTYTCNDTTGAWEKTCGECTTSPCNGKQPSKGETYTELCVPNQPQVGSVYYTWNWETCEYDRNASGCKDCTKPTHNGEEVWWVTSGCPNMQVGCTIYTWDYDSCDYKKSYDCKDKENGTRIWSNYKQLASYETGMGYCVSAANQYYANQAHTINTDENYARIKAFIASSNTKCPSGTMAGGKVPDDFTGDRCWTGFFSNAGDQCPRCSPGVMSGPYTDESGGCMQTGSSSCEGSTTTTVCVMPYRYGVYFVVNQ